MALAVSAWFNEVAESAVRKIWSDLSVNGIDSSLVDGPIRPHITFGIYENLSLEVFSPKLRETIEARDQFECLLSQTQFFCNQQLIAYLAVDRTEPLLSLQKIIHSRALETSTCLASYYYPEQWNPHCSLATDLAECQLQNFTRYMQSVELPIKAIIERVGIVQLPEEIELQHFNLR